MRRPPGTLLAVLLFLASAGACFAAGAAGAPPSTAATAAAPFAALTVTPRGAQEYDISTGVTTLPDGGSIIDEDTGVSLAAKQITYLDGSYIEARGASVSGAFGRLTAATLHIDVKTGVLTASGDLSLARDALTLKAGKLTYYATRRVADFSGTVTGTSPAFRADRLLLDALSGNVLLLGDYRYAGAAFTLRAPEGGGRLELTLHQVDGVPVYDAATDVSPGLLARFAAELN